LPNRHYNGHHRAIETGDDQRTRGKEIWRKECDSRSQVQLEEDGSGKKAHDSVENNS